MYVTTDGTAKRTSFLQQEVGYDYTENHSKFSKRVTDSVCRVLDSRLGRAARDSIFWNLSITSVIGLGDIADMPYLFISGLKAIYGGAMETLELAMVEELRLEFGLNENNEGQVRHERFVDVLARAGNPA
jgi:hypothetical protein